MKQTEMVMDVHEVPKARQWLLLSIQHLFAMFGSTILVPFLTDLSIAVALVSSGLGTLAYLVITRGKIPAYLGSSFAFIVPIISVMGATGPGGVMIGSFLAGAVYGLVALFIRLLGLNWLMRILPPIVVGPVIMVIGLSLAATAVDMAMYKPGTEQVYSGTHLSVALVTLAIAIIATIFFKGFFGLIPILIGITGGYIYGLFAGIIDTSGIVQQWHDLTTSGSFGGFVQAVFKKPDFVLPFIDYSPLSVFNTSIILLMVPVALVTIAEHIGDQMVLSKIAGRNFLKRPGLHRSILGDGVATMIASVLGGRQTQHTERILAFCRSHVSSVCLS
ncbi:Uracil permease [Lentibacillus sp. JNUCC-1]|nr:Uracil permease [Lentibacillus sp. JNUCC-1]